MLKKTMIFLAVCMYFFYSLYYKIFLYYNKFVFVGKEKKVCVVLSG